MTLKSRIREKALELGFVDAGFTSVEPFDLYIKEIDSRPEMYQWALTEDFNPLRAATPQEKHPWAKSILVLLSDYHSKRFPSQLIGTIGRCYQVDTRNKPGEGDRGIENIFDLLEQEGIKFLADDQIPARMSSARAGVVTYGKNCFMYAKNGMLGSSWVTSMSYVLDREIEPDEPSIELGCPSWCKNACIAACPTGALYAPKKMNPLKCIAFNSYYAGGMTPMELREPMGTWVYGCDRCQDVCPRNQPWLSQDLPKDQALTDRAPDFHLDTLLTMTQDHYENKVWPQHFYISRENREKWQMNAARAIGNRGNREDVPLLATSLVENPYESVRGMSAWALGQLGGSRSRKALESHRGKEDGLVRQEIELALG
ncbi:MAG: 4Fe-4S double cluster binding domain-containing protein [Desulfobacterales bacterium]